MTLTAAAIAAAGPIRAAATAAASTLRRDLGVCRDRSHILAARMLDAALAAAEERHGRS